MSVCAEEERKLLLMFQPECVCVCVTVHTCICVFARDREGDIVCVCVEEGKKHKTQLSGSHLTFKKPASGGQRKFYENRPTAQQR